MNAERRETIRAQLHEISDESLIPICICRKDISKEEMEPNLMFSDSGGSAEDIEDFMMSQRGFTLVAVAFFSNPVNIWIPSSLSKLTMCGVESKLISSCETAGYYSKECGIMNDEDEEFEAKEFYEKGQNN